MRTHTHTHIYTRTCVQTNIHTNTHTHTHTHTHNTYINGHIVNTTYVLITLQSDPLWPGGQKHFPIVVLHSPNLHCGRQSVHWNEINLKTHMYTHVHTHTHTHTHTHKQTGNYTCTRKHTSTITH